MHDDAGIRVSERSSPAATGVERAVFRPGVGQYIYIGWAPALAVLAGLGITVAAVEPQAQDRITNLVAGITIAVCGGVLLAYLFGMSIEVDQESVSKVYMFGLVHVAIPLPYLKASTATEHQSGSLLEWSYTRLDFESSDGVGDGFGAYPFWVWRQRDMDTLLALATSTAEWRASHPTPLRPEPPPTLGAFLKLAALMTWVGGILAAVPLAFLYLKWGGLATLSIASVVELALVGLSARLTWGPQSASKKASESPSERVHLPRPRNHQASSVEERDPVVPASDVNPPVGVTESDSMALNAYTRPANELQSRALDAALPSFTHEERERTGTGWAILLSVAALFMLVIGIGAATQSHAWTPLWPLNIVGGVMSYVPCVVWVAFGNRLSDRPLFLWPARVVALILTVAIPFIIWGPVPAPPS